MGRRKTLIFGFWDRMDEIILEDGRSKNEIARLMRVNRKNLYRSDYTMNPLYLAKFCFITGASADYLLGLSTKKYYRNLIRERRLHEQTRNNKL